MNYWNGKMDWELDKDWKCPTCHQNKGLEWGLVHGQCRCNICHTQFQMRADDKERTVLTIPRCMLKEDYKEPIRLAYEKYRISLDDITDEMISEFREAR